VSCEKIECQIFVKESTEELASECAAHILGVLAEALKSRDSATIAVSGGSTPKRLFGMLAKASFDWSRVHVFWVDERCVPPSDDQSNYKLARETLLAPARIPDTNGEPLIADRKGIAAPVWVEKMKSHRVTLLPGVLLAARRTVIEAVGEDKAGPVHSVLEGPIDLFRFPCQIAARDHVAWFLDKSAASKL
jgi:6-phosphogluconolactonase